MKRAAAAFLESQLARAGADVAVQTLRLSVCLLTYISILFDLISPLALPKSQLQDRAAATAGDTARVTTANNFSLRRWNTKWRICKQRARADSTTMAKERAGRGEETIGTPEQRRGRARWRCPPRGREEMQQ